MLGARDDWPAAVLKLPHAEPPRPPDESALPGLLQRLRELEADPPKADSAWEIEAEYAPVLVPLRRLGRKAADAAARSRA